MSVGFAMSRTRGKAKGKADHLHLDCECPAVILLLGEFFVSHGKSKAASMMGLHSC